MADDADRIINLAAAREDAAWFRRLAKNKDDVPHATIANAMIILANDPALKDMFAHNAFTSQNLILRAPPLLEAGAQPMPGPYPRGWGAHDISMMQAYFQRVWSDRFRRQDVEHAMVGYAMTQPFHPIAEWLDSLVWDGVKRLDNWIINTFDPANPEGDQETVRYYQAVASKFLIAAVRRIRSPGCKFDCMPIFEGPQGIGKSTVMRKLFGDEYFSDAIPPDLSSKDTAMSLMGVWLLEFAEIEHLIRQETETTKAFFSRQTDRYRPPYARDFVWRPRQGVMAGTTNSDDYLRDATGNRRYWPVPCQTADVAWVELNRDQLWAEAASREAGGEDVWFTDNALIQQSTAVANDRLTDEVWEPAIKSWLAEGVRPDLTAAQVLEYALGMNKEKMTKAYAMRVAVVLRGLGYQRKVVKNGKSTKRVWRKPDEVQVAINYDNDTFDDF